MAPVEAFNVQDAFGMAIEYVTEPGPLLTAAALGVMAPPLNGFVVFVGAQVSVWFA
jgi:hypothetical protein